MAHDEIRYIAMDMDGTILNKDYVLSPKVAWILGICRKQGKKIIISTGRVYSSAAKHVEAMGGADGFVCSNGADVYADGDTPIFEKHMDEALSRTIVDISRRYDSHFHAFIGENWYYEREKSYTDFYTRRTGLSGHHGDFDTFKTLKFTKCMFLDDHDRLEFIARELRKELEGKVQIMYSNPIMLEVVVNGVNKAAGLSACVGYWGGSLGQTIAFGDANNDEEMLLAAGVGVAMGNADDDLKAKIGNVAPSVDDDGVAVFLQNFFQL
ncbi:MAG: HAD family hydrolase [Spirochaetes bacterium]|nr:HAD family hydrolase [Spirochaetota bacterium]